MSSRFRQVVAYHLTRIVRAQRKRALARDIQAAQRDIDERQAGLDALRRKANALDVAEILEGEQP